jgi:hypothetical protein
VIFELKTRKHENIIRYPRICMFIVIFERFSLVLARGVAHGAARGKSHLVLAHGAAQGKSHRFGIEWM